VVPILSPAAKKSDYVTFEWSFALGVGIPVIPVIFQKTNAHPRLQTLQCIDFARQPNPDWTKLINELDKRIDNVPFPALRDFLEFRNSLRTLSEILNATGKQTFYQYVSGLMTHANGFRLKDEDWALQCNSAFWQSLSNYQKKQTNGGQKIQAFVTHTASPEIWLGDEAKPSLEQQKAFFKSGGKIVRVFIGKFAAPDGGDGRYQKAMKLMSKYDVHSFYVQRPKRDNSGDDYTWIPGLGILQTWTSKIRFDDHIQEVDLSEANDVVRIDQGKYWNRLKRMAVDLKGRRLESYPEYQP
jgi:hypothetical protein